MIEKAIGKRIKEYRQKKGMTQDELAEILDVSSHHLSAMERGVYNIKLSTLVLIINTLGCTADDLFCDVIDSGYKMRSSRLEDKLDGLPADEQAKILDVVELLIKNSK